MIKRYILITNIAFLITFVPACGKLAPEFKVKGGTEHTVNTNSNIQGNVKTTSEFTFKIDVSGCDKLTGSNQATCITETIKALGDLVTMVKQFACKDDTCKIPTTIPVGESK